MDDTDEVEEGAPHWMVTYGDLMSLLLTFFILLASMSEIKENDKYQGVADWIHHHFGDPLASRFDLAGQLKPRSAALAAVATAGQSRREALLRGPTRQPRPRGDERTSAVMHSGDRTTMGAAIWFGQGDSLTDVARSQLRDAAQLFQGKPQKIEIRSYSPPSLATAAGRPVWDDAYRRAENTMRFLVDDLGIDSRRIRISLAGPNEPAEGRADSAASRQSAKVEVFLLEEVVSDPAP
jgi:chemotaxis protein MotB